MRQRATIKEMVGIIEESEGNAITEMAIRKSLSRAGITPDKHDHKVDVAQALSARVSSKKMDKTNLLQNSDDYADTESYAGAKIKHINLQCKKIEIQIQQILGTLIPVEDVKKDMDYAAANLIDRIEAWASTAQELVPEEESNIIMLKESLRESLLDACKKYNS
jgi:hypothetical protein